QPFENEAEANRYSRVELQNQLNNLIRQRATAESELSVKKNDLDRHKTLLDKGVISAQEYESKQLSYFQAERSLNNLRVSISQTQSAIGNANKTSRGTEINRAKEEIQLLKAVNQSFNRLKKAIKDWEFNYVLRSNMEGKVSFMNVWTANQTVNTGDLVFTIIPSENSSYVAKLRAPAQNSGKIKPGQIVNIKLENFPDDEFGVLKGRVKNSALIPDEEGFYRIDVVLPEKLITTYGKEIPFKQEMRGIAEIITEDLRLIERFFYQLKDVFSS
ncbi:MAG: HlyD family efflux transporter periplasmic adaptor subunit, partial [Bacteroidota bacterium]